LLDPVLQGSLPMAYYVIDILHFPLDFAYSHNYRMGMIAIIDSLISDLSECINLLLCILLRYFLKFSSVLENKAFLELR
jgi:hypothetical protein